MVNITDPRAEAIAQDLSGQVKEALLKEYYDKWGKHYLPSIARAHLLQQCNNFKDPGVQYYGISHPIHQNDLFEFTFKFVHI